jgi:hypothetical protein
VGVGAIRIFHILCGWGMTKSQNRFTTCKEENLPLSRKCQFAGVLSKTRNLRQLDFRLWDWAETAHLQGFCETDIRKPLLIGIFWKI